MGSLTAPHAILLIVHLLLFVYWLGGDVDVFYSSRFVVDSALPRGHRRRALVANQVTPGTDARMQASLGRMRPRVLAIWVGVLAAAVLGVVKPGG